MAISKGCRNLGEITKELERIRIQDGLSQKDFAEVLHKILESEAFTCGDNCQQKDLTRA